MRLDFPVDDDQTANSCDFFTLSLRPRESTGNIAAKGGEHWSTFCTRNTDCKIPTHSIVVVQRVSSFHDIGPGRLEISAACTSTYGYHAACNSLHHVLLDVTVQLCDEHRQTKNRVQRSRSVNCTHSCKKAVSRYTRGELVPLGIKWSCRRALGNCTRRICARCDANTNKRQRHLI